jgi:hypothetical protein
MIACQAVRFNPYKTTFARCGSYCGMENEMLITRYRTVNSDATSGRQ